MRVVGIIPARMASSRFPGKPLAKILGLTMVEHVYRRAKRSPLLDEVVIATCDDEIREAALSFGGRVAMTSPMHQRGTDRVAEAAESIAADIIVNVQGDEPLLHPDSLTLLCQPLIRDPGIGCTNLANVIDSDDDFNNPDQVKVVCDQRGNALYMSRESIPTARYLGAGVPRLRQQGFYAFTREVLREFQRLPATPLEQAESVDMLRLVEHGCTVRMVVSPYESVGVDRPEDIATVEELMAGDSLFPLYAQTVQ